MIAHIELDEHEPNRVYLVCNDVEGYYKLEKHTTNKHRGSGFWCSSCDAATDENCVDTDGELKPCPFCGKKPNIVYCGPGVYVSCCNYDCPCTCEAWGENEDKAEEAWNARAERTCTNVHEPPNDAIFWPAPHFKCSECGVTHVSMEYVFFCPNCGRKVVDG